MNLTKLQERFLNTKYCERCFRKLKIRSLSYFTTEVICGECLEKERQLKKQLINSGIKISEYEWCGYLPKLIKSKKGVKIANEPKNNGSSRKRVPRKENQYQTIGH